MRVVIAAILSAFSLGAAAAEETRSSFFGVDWRELGAALAPEASVEKRSWGLGYVAAVLDELGCGLNRRVEPPAVLKRDYAETELVAKATYQVFLDRQRVLAETMPGLIGGNVLVRAATVRLWDCDLKRRQ